MEIKEVESLLSISRSNIRFYEKQGLLSPNRRENNYREYTEEDITALKKIVMLRKMGFTVKEISLMQKGELSFNDAVPDVKIRLESEIEQLNGALNTVCQISKEYTSFEEIDVNKCWESMQRAEESGEKFIDICKDCLELELKLIDNMWKFVFFHDFKKSRARHGVIKACIMLILLCIFRGIGSVSRHESFWSGFLYPWRIALAGSIIVLPLFILSKKAPKIASIIATVLLGLIILFFIGIILLFLYGFFNLIIT